MRVSTVTSFSIILRLAAAISSLPSVADASCWHSWDESYPCRDLLVLRGGASALLVAASTAVHNSINGFGSDDECRLELNDVSLSLRYTCEMNRRLNAAVKMQASIHDSLLEGTRGPHNTNPAVSIHRGGQMVHVHPSQQWEPPIRVASDESDDLTLFHANAPRDSRTGVKRWGPDLLLYLQHLTTALNIQDDPLVLKLAILYLDRACSVETPRSHGQEKCPFLVPRTVHRLLLTSLLIAQKAVNPNSQSELSSLGIPSYQLEQMQDWMRQSLGDMGVYVSESQLADFDETWERTFRSPKLKIRRRKQQHTLIRSASQGEQYMSSQQTHSSSSDDVVSRDHLSEVAFQCWS